MKRFKCNCLHCKTHRLYKWATVMECKCCCHEDGFMGHDRLCCALPNVLKANNPHTKLKTAIEYRLKLDKMQKDAYDEYDRFREASRENS